VLLIAGLQYNWIGLEQTGL